MINYIFILIYAIASYFLSGIDLYILLTVHFLILLIEGLRQKKNFINPLTIYYTGIIIINAANIILLSRISGGGFVKIYAYIVPKYIDDAAAIWCIGSTMFVAGYNAYSKKALPSISLEIKNKNILKYIFYFLVAENVLLILGSGINIKGNQIGKVFALLNTIGILFYARLWAKNDNKTYMNYAIILYVIETYLALITSYLRFELILPTFYLFIGYFIGKSDIKFLFSYRIIPLIVILLLFSSVFNSLQTNRSNFISTFTASSNQNITYSETATDEESGGLLSRNANVAQMTNVVKLVKRNGFYNGKASAPIATALIPRFLWPDKPLIELGAWFAVEIGVAYKNDMGRANNSINMTVPGELYLDFGWIGVLAGCFLFGGFMSVLWNATKFYTDEFNITGTIFGGYLIEISLGSYADLQIVVTLTSTYIIFYVIKKLVKKL